LELWSTGVVGEARGGLGRRWMIEETFTTE
jgi:hypothetical protein